MEEKSSLDTVYTPERHGTGEGKELATATQQPVLKSPALWPPGVLPSRPASPGYRGKEAQGSGNRDQGGWLGSGIWGVELEKTPKGLFMSSFLPSFSTQQLDKLSEKPSQVHPRDAPGMQC